MVRVDRGSAASDERGTALGVYNTMQSIGLFVGGAAGGWLIKDFGMQGLFAVCAAALLVWLVAAWSMQAIPSAEKLDIDEALA